MPRRRKGCEGVRLVLEHDRRNLKACCWWGRRQALESMMLGSLHEMEASSCAGDVGLGPATPAVSMWGGELCCLGRLPIACLTGLSTLATSWLRYDTVRIYMCTAAIATAQFRVSDVLQASTSSRVGLDIRLSHIIIWRIHFLRRG